MFLLMCQQSVNDVGVDGVNVLCQQSVNDVHVAGLMWCVNSL